MDSVSDFGDFSSAFPSHEIDNTTSQVEVPSQVNVLTHNIFPLDWNLDDFPTVATLPPLPTDGAVPDIPPLPEDLHFDLTSGERDFVPTMTHANAPNKVLMVFPLLHPKYYMHIYFCKYRMFQFMALFV